MKPRKDFRLGEELVKAMEEVVEMERGRRAAEHSADNTPVKSITPFSPQKMKRLRKELKFSTKVMANILGASPKSIQVWESGKIHPNNIVYRLYEILDRHPEYINELIEE
ncbi:MAG: type II toxin-antitoxin system MqsA family antitoxin [Spirochaetes bacterium]|nr:type II toxin-antitoxin system MqsA family antitoxin [Spirochaetota bacterium]